MNAKPVACAFLCIVASLLIGVFSFFFFSPWTFFIQLSAGTLLGLCGFLILLKEGLRSFFTGLLLFLCFHPFSAISSSPKDSIQFGGSLRFRSETLYHFNAFTPTRSGVNNDSFVLMRLRPRVTIQPEESFRVFVEPQISRTFAQEESTVANGNNIDDFDLHQGYVDFFLPGDWASFRLGRQELSYGDERLLGAFGWSNVGRSHDAVKLRGEWDSFWIDSFFSWIQRSAGNQYLAGSYGHWAPTDKMVYEPFLLFWTDRDGGVGGRPVELYTVGDRLVWKSGRWDTDWDGALQFGRSAGNNVSAFFGHAAGGYTFDTVTAKPRVGLEYNIASGDKTPNGGSVRGFNQLFPTNHDKYGFMDLVGLRNIHNLRGSFSVRPKEQWKIGLDYHAFFLFHPEDGLYQASGAQVRAGAAGASRFAGQEGDVSLQYQWNPHADFLLGYSAFFAGDFLGDTGVKKNAHFLYAQTVVSF